jgi:hypothetical protein
VLTTKLSSDFVTHLYDAGLIVQTLGVTFIKEKTSIVTGQRPSEAINVTLLFLDRAVAHTAGGGQGGDGGGEHCYFIRRLLSKIKRLLSIIKRLLRKFWRLQRGKRRLRSRKSKLYG